MAVSGVVAVLPGGHVPCTRRTAAVCSDPSALQVCPVRDALPAPGDMRGCWCRLTSAATAARAAVAFSIAPLVAPCQAMPPRAVAVHCQKQGQKHGARGTGPAGWLRALHSPARATAARSASWCVSA